jgi:nucleoside-diphosphate-sugar epimerase
VLQLAERIITLSGSPSGIKYVPLPQDDPRFRCPDITLATRALGRRPEASWRDGLAETLAWFAARLEAGAGVRT